MSSKLILLILVVFLISIASALDTDGDGLDDLTENEIGTRVTDMDTDDDGFSDGVETDFGSDPLDDKDTPDSKITGQTVLDIKVKNYLISLLVITLVAQVGVLFYLRRRNESV